MYKFVCLYACSCVCVSVCVEIHRKMLLSNSPYIFKKYPACFDHPSYMVCKNGGKW